METQQPEQQSVTVLAQMRLTEQQVQQAIAEFLMKDEKLNALAQQKQLRLVTQWQTHKWSDPNALVHVFFTEDASVDSSATPIDESTTDTTSGPDLGTPLGSPFFREAT